MNLDPNLGPLPRIERRNEIEDEIQQLEERANRTPPNRRYRAITDEIKGFIRTTNRARRKSQRIRDPSHTRIATELIHHVIEALKEQFNERRKAHLE